MYIRHYIQWRQQQIAKDGQLLLATEAEGGNDIPLAIYQQAGIGYPKFFKMDPLSRVAFLATELLLPPVTEVDKSRIATVISTGSGCLEVDKKFEESRHSLASPALFVYTLPNIMLGEIDIRHGFKGEQMCTISEKPDPAWFAWYVSDLLQYRGTQACLFGHVEVTADMVSATLLWVSKEQPVAQAAIPFTQANLELVFNPSFT